MTIIVQTKHKEICKSFPKVELLIRRKGIIEIEGSLQTKNY